MQVAALEAVLAMYATGRRDELPVWRMLREPAAAVRQRAQRLAVALDGDLEGAHVVETTASVGGGSMPGHALPSAGVRLRVPDPTAFAARLRAGSTPVLCRLGEDHVLLDLRTVRDEDVPHLARAVLYALEAEDVEG
jgi:L-seryl-tRNA(Ser) seleniumtransferase